MAQILVRNLNQKVVKRLKKLAKAEGRSLQSELKIIIERAAHEPRVDSETALKRIKEIRQRFKGRAFPDTVSLIREDRGR
jgi:plasmid stability protein